jgi:hypothetical protein
MHSLRQRLLRPRRLCHGWLRMLIILLQEPVQLVYCHLQWRAVGSFRSFGCSCHVASAPGPTSFLPHLHRDLGLAYCHHICTGTEFTPATSAPGLASSVPHLASKLLCTRSAPGLCTAVTLLAS